MEENKDKAGALGKEVKQKGGKRELTENRWGYEKADMWNKKAEFASVKVEGSRGKVACETVKAKGIHALHLKLQVNVLTWCHINYTRDNIA